jgi:hypothetical protein
MHAFATRPVAAVLVIVTTNQRPSRLPTELLYCYSCGFTCKGDSHYVMWISFWAWAHGLMGSWAHGSHELHGLLWAHDMAHGSWALLKLQSSRQSNISFAREALNDF